MEQGSALFDDAEDDSDAAEPAFECQYVRFPSRPAQTRRSTGGKAAVLTTDGLPSEAGAGPSVSFGAGFVGIADLVHMGKYKDAGTAGSALWTLAAEEEARTKAASIKGVHRGRNGRAHKESRAYQQQHVLNKGVRLTFPAARAPQLVRLCSTVHARTVVYQTQRRFDRPSGSAPT